MKVLVALSLIVLAAAKPQFIQHPLVIPTVKTAENTPVINTYTASYPNAGFPYVQAALPYNYRFSNIPQTYNPFFTFASPVVAANTVETSREKRSADPEPEADPAVVYTTGVHTTGSAINYPTLATIPATIPTTALNYQYTGFPAAVSTYTYPQTLPYTGFPYAGLNPIAGVSPYTSISPYASFPWFNQGFNPFVTPAQATTAVVDDATVAGGDDVSVTRAKRSADPEADPQLLTTGFTYPAVNTKTSPSTFAYQTYPSTYTIPNTGFQARTYTVPNTGFQAGTYTLPTTYNTAGFPFYQQGAFPAATTGVIYGG